MRIDPKELRRQTAQVMQRVDAELREMEEATAPHTPFVASHKEDVEKYTSLLATKASCLNTFALLNDQK